jgi:hypothetical protein
MRYKDHLLTAFVAGLYGHAPEMMPLPGPTRGIAATADRMRRRALAAALAPCKPVIAATRAAERAARAPGLRAPAILCPPQGTQTPGPVARFKPSRIDP